MTQAQKLRLRLERIKGQKAALERQIRGEKGRRSQLYDDYQASTQAHLILQEAAKMTQDNLQYRISTLVSLAMEGVFDDPYSVQLIFEPQRGKTVADIRFFKNEEDDGITYEATGGGVADVASLGLLFSLWTLQTPRTRNLLILDEPLKWLKGGALPERGAAMLVSHSPELIEHADRVFQVTKKRGISSVKCLK